MKVKTIYECEVCGKQFSAIPECVKHEENCTNAKFFNLYFDPISIFEIEEADFIYLPTELDYNKICKIYPFLKLDKSYIPFPLILLRVGNTGLWRDFSGYMTEIKERLK